VFAGIEMLTMNAVMLAAAFGLKEIEMKLLSEPERKTKFAGAPSPVLPLAVTVEGGKLLLQTTVTTAFTSVCEEL
jgi:hypothetical protein